LAGNFGHSKSFYPNGGKAYKGDNAMKKYKWFFAVIAALILTTVIVLNVSAKTTDSMGGDCVEDGSCCEDEDTCSCG
jgi:hypothetical protein